MPRIDDIYSLRESPGITAAPPATETPYSDVFSAAAQNELVAGTDNLVAQPAAREQAYDARIRAIKDQTGIELENPERGGYSIEARRAIRQAVIAGGMSPIDETGGIPAYQKRIFDQKLAEVQQKHPDLNLPTETAEGIAHASGDTLSRAMGQPDLNPVAKYGAEFAGSLYGERRNPLFLGSLFAGPTGAVGRTALAKVATSALSQGLTNVGIAQLGKAATRQWQAQIGRDEGILLSPAEVGASFLMGAIPGAGIEAGKIGFEHLPSIRRVLSGRPEAGDIAKASEALGPVRPPAAAAMRAGEESLAADGATLRGYHGSPVPFEDLRGEGPFYFTEHPDAASAYAMNPAPGQPLEAPHVMPADLQMDKPYRADARNMEQMANARDKEWLQKNGYDSAIVEHPDDPKAQEFVVLDKSQIKPALSQFDHDLMGAALKRADDPAAPSPEAVAAVSQPVTGELQNRIQQAAPQTPADAARAADEALDDFGRRDGMAALRERMQAARDAQDEATEAWRDSEDRLKRRPSDVMNKIPMMDSNGKEVLRSERYVRSMGEIEDVKADLVRSCK